MNDWYQTRQPRQVQAWRVESLDGEETRQLPPRWFVHALAMGDIGISTTGTVSNQKVYSPANGKMFAAIGDWVVKENHCAPFNFMANDNFNNVYELQPEVRSE